MLKRTLSSLVFIMFAALALWIVGISSGVVNRVAKVIMSPPGPVPEILAKNSPSVESPSVESQTAKAPKSTSTILGANKPALSDLQTVSSQNEINHPQPSVAQIQKPLPLTKMPLYFVQNAGQVDKKFKYYEQASTHATYFAPDGIYIMLSKLGAQQTVSAKSPSVANKQSVSEVVKLSPLQANKNPEILAEAKQTGVVNYYIGNDPKAWKEGLATYQSVRYKEIYPGVDVRYYGDNSQLIYDVIVKAGADPSQIQFQYEGVDNLQVSANGDLEITLAQGSITQKKPFIYQEVNGQRVAVEGQFKLLSGEQGKHAYGFQVASYDNSRELVIDPTIVYSTYQGGTPDEVAYAITVDAAGNTYYTGSASSPFPTTTGPAYAGGSTDAFVTRRLASGAISWTTYFGGSGSDVGRAIALSSDTTNGYVYVVGATNSSNLPIGGDTSHKAGPAGGDDGFVVNFGATTGALGKIIGYVGGTGSDYATGVVVTGADPTDRIYVTGYTNSPTFPLRDGVAPVRVGQAVKGTGYDAFMVELVANPPWIFQYVTYLGGTGDDFSNGIALSDAFPNDITGWAKVVLTGSTAAPDFPSSVSAYQPTYSGSPVGATDVFVSKLDTSLAGASSILFSTYLGGTGSDTGWGIALDAANNVYITGETTSTNFPTLSPYQAATRGGKDVFLTKLNSTGSGLLYSTYLGGNGNFEAGYGIALDSLNNIYLTGRTNSSDFPVVRAIQSVYGTTIDAFVSRFSAAGNLLYSTYLGGNSSENGNGIAVKTLGGTSSVAQTSAYVVGRTYSTDFPSSTGATQTAISGTGSDAFFTQINNALPSLSYSSETGYGSDGVNSDYLDLNSGTVTTKFTYKVVYTHLDNVSPNLNPASSITVCIDSGASAFCPPANSYTMQLDTSAASGLRDGDFSNGEQYYYSTLLATGSHNYFFEANDGISTTRLPLGTASSAGPTVSSMVINTNSLTPAQKTQSYNATLLGSGGTSPTWSIVGLPASLVVSSAGVISGTPQNQGAQTLDTTTQYYPLTIYLSDVTGRYTTEIPLAVNPAADISAPTQPTSLTATPGAAQVLLNWSPSTDYYGVTQYQVWRYPSGVPASSSVVGTTTVKPGIDPATSFLNTGLAPSTSYTFAVRARDLAANWSAYSSAVSVTTLTLATMPLGEAADSTLILTSFGDALWYVQGTSFYPGGNNLNTAPRSGGSSVPITHTQSTSLTTSMTGPGTLSFQWKVSSEDQGGCTNLPLVGDCLSFNLNGSAVAGISPIAGEMGWTLVSVAIPVGTHNVTWTYAKDGSGSAGSDAAWVDQVTFIPVETSRIAAGAYHTVTINADGSLWAWGDNSYNQLGDGSPPTPWRPAQRRPAQIGTGFKEVAAGDYHTVAIKTDGSLWAWGRNDNGQLGDGTLVNRSLPTRIGTGTGWTAVAAGSFHTVAMSGVAGAATLYAWGDNQYGQLGDNTVIDKLIPTLVAGGIANYQSITAGAYHTAAIRADGTLRAWGHNSYGQLGDGTVIQRNTPTQIGTSTAWRSVAAGDYHTVADRVNNAVYAWGANDQGQLGDNTTVNRLIPTLLTGASYKALSAGNYHSIAIKSTDGTVWAWGGNSDGQLGDATSTQRNTPVQAGAAGGLTATAVETGAAHTLAIKSDGTMWAWGNNSYGQLGTGMLNWSNVPVQISTAGSSDQQKPTVPTGLTLAPSPNPYTLSWTASTDNVAVTQYQIYRNGVYINTVASAPFTDAAPLTNGTYTVAACDAAGNCSAQTAAVGRDVTAPSTPGIPVANVTSTTEIYLSWAASTDAVGVTRYEVYRETPAPANTLMGSPTSNSFTATNLAPNIAHTFTVKACDAANNCSVKSGLSASKNTLSSPDLTPPTVPGPVSAGVSGTTINLTWTASTDMVAPFTGVKEYRIYRNDSGSALVNVSGSPYADTGRRLDSTYKYIVAACDWAGNCASSSSVSATITSSGSIPLPTALDNATLTFIRSGSASWYGSSVASAVGGSAAMSGELGDAASAIPVSSILTASGISGPGTLSYLMKVSSESGDFLSFNVDGADVPGIPPTSGEVDWVTRSVNIPTPGAHTATWTYSKDSSGTAGSDAAWIDQVVFTPSTLDVSPPSPPTGVSATAISGSQIDLSWVASTDNTAVTEYQIFQALPVIGSSMVGSSTNNSFSHTGLANSTSYRYQVRAGDAAGNWSTLSASSVSVTTPSDAAAPVLQGGASAGLIATAISSSQINLSWTAATDDVGVTQYELWRYKTIDTSTASAVVGVITGTPPVTSFINTVGLEPSTGYTYQIRAGDASGKWSGWSAGVPVSTPAAAVTNVDLLMTALSATPTTDVTPGTNVTLTSTMKNQGSAAMTASRTYIFFYLSADSAITATDTLIGYRLVNTSLAASAVSTGTTIARLPTNLAGGATYYVGAIADALNQQIESLENNNATIPASAIPITIPFPPVVDLQPTAVSATPGTVAPGANLTLSSTIWNRGTEAMTMNSTTVGYYLSADNVISTADTLLGSYKLNIALAASGVSVLPSITVALPSTVNSGSYFVGAIADSLGEQPEYNESNNTTSGAMAIPVTVSAQTVDLRMTAISGTPTSVEVGKTFTLTDTMTNEGSSATIARRTYVGYYLSTSSAVVSATTVPTTDTRIGFRLVNATLTASGTPGASSMGSTAVTIPTSMAAGTYYIRAMADVLNQQGESNETNNILTNTSPITVTLPNVDLVMTAVSAVPSVTTVARGGSFTINDTEKNNGTATMSVSNNYVFYYLSSDNIITTDDTRIGYRLVNTSLVANGISSGTATLATVPTTLTPGTYYLGAIADALNQQPEIGGNNNSMLGAQITVTP